jgi:hypothetical protein
VTDCHNHNRNLVIPDVSYDAIVAYPVAPEAFQIAKKSMAEAARILSSCDPFAKTFLNCAPRFMTKLS